MGGLPLSDDDWRNADMTALLDAILALETREEAAAFLRDLCTRRELEEMRSRWAVARLLADGHPYREIAELTGVSTATITRISQWLHHGMGGYRLALERLAGADTP